LTLEVYIWTRVLDATRRLDVVYIYAKLFWNPTMHVKVKVRTRMCVPLNSKCKYVNLQTVSVTLTWGRDMVLRRVTSSWCDRPLCQVILKSSNAMQSYSPDTKLNAMWVRTDGQTDRRMKTVWFLLLYPKSWCYL
jgi:hypothetical protein